MREIMCYEDFKEELVKKLQNRSMDQIELKSILKNNDTHQDAVILHKVGSNIAPTIYLWPFYEKCKEGETMEAIVERILNLGEQKMPEEFDVNGFMDWEQAKEHICFRLVNKEYNKELLEDVPYTEFLNLAVIYCYVFKAVSDNQLASITIHNAHLNYWNITEEELDQVARDNTEKIQGVIIQSMQDILKEMVGSEAIEGDLMNPPMYVLSNRTKINGASTILYTHVLKEFADQIDADLFILPSSTHEVLLIPANPEIDSQELLDMVKSVNETQVDPEEQLADSVYYYDRANEKVIIAA